MEIRFMVREQGKESGSLWLQDLEPNLVPKELGPLIQIPRLRRTESFGLLCVGFV